MKRIEHHHHLMIYPVFIGATKAMHGLPAVKQRTFHGKGLQYAWKGQMDRYRLPMINRTAKGSALSQKENSFSNAQAIKSEDITLDSKKE